jgi:Mn-dependent DtxR family transcriptional regulator
MFAIRRVTKVTKEMKSRGYVDVVDYPVVKILTEEDAKEVLEEIQSDAACFEELSIHQYEEKGVA